MLELNWTVPGQAEQLLTAIFSQEVPHIVRKKNEKEMFKIKENML